VIKEKIAGKGMGTGKNGSAEEKNIVYFF